MLSSKINSVFGSMPSVNWPLVRIKVKCLSKLPILRFYGVVYSLRFLNLGSNGTNLVVIFQFRGKAATHTLSGGRIFEV